MIAATSAASRSSPDCTALASSANTACAAARKAAASATSPFGSRSESALASPRAVGTQNRAGRTNANSSSTS